ncbi:MAG: 16S rRNA (cytosine(967)-C(5))-methyltransferase RsmB [Sporolactobacillus sp.]|jgi:16S rRNA (cytosine967-C5)-methyltransferase|nr:16S rRNA (cytosine(967)-C(5))-methyltransferase RsmB [Sporolactobacillus sp.]
MRSKTARETALDLLIRILRDGAYSQIVLNEALIRSTVSEKDKKLITVLVYGVLQRKLTLDFILSRLISTEKTDQWVRVLLMTAVYQKIYLDRIPDHAIVNETVKIAGKRGHPGIRGFVNAVLRRFLREGVPDLPAGLSESRRLAIETSHPEWMLNLWTQQWDPETARRIAENGNTVPPVFVRINRTKTTRAELIGLLEREGISAQPGRLSADCLKITSGHANGSTALADGLITVQDESSMLVADVVAPEKGSVVLDACAGPGGKATHLGERLSGCGSVLALDLHEHKTRLIDRAAHRLGLTDIRTMALDARRAKDTLPAESFDRVLLDVPCSGLGVIRRKPEIKWEKKKTDIAPLTDVQQALLESAAPLVRAGGWLIYSTCTISREENDRQLFGFLAGHREFEWEPGFFSRLPGQLESCRVAGGCSMIQLMPGQFGTDGFFIGCLRRKK